MKNSVKVLFMLYINVEQEFNTKYEIQNVLSKITCFLSVFLKESTFQKTMSN